MTDIYLELSLVLGLALGVSLIVKWLKQPLIIGYIITGVIAGQAFLAWVTHDSLESFSQIGITLLLFIVGLSLNPKTLKEVGKVAFWAGLGQIVFTSIIGYAVARAIGFAQVTSIYLALAMTFSSTVVILRLLHEKGDQDKLYGRVLVGFLLIQDFVAMIVLAVLASVSNAASENILVIGVELSAKLIIVGAAIYLCMKFLVPRIDSKLAHNREILFLGSLALAFIMAALFNYLGFSMELGALLAGIMLSVSPYETEISSRVRPLRDFFLIVFFIVMGSRLEINMINSYLFEAIVFSLFVLIGNPLIVMILMGIKGYTKKTSFYTGVAVAQISEFSLILLIMGISVGHLSPEILGFATVVALITIIGSTYFIYHTDKIYKKLENILVFFEKKTARTKEEDKKVEAVSALVFGCHRLGGGILSVLESKRNKYLAIDYDPVLVKKLSARGMNVIFGDISNPAFLDTLDYSKAKVVISTIPDFKVNKYLIRYFDGMNFNGAMIFVANQYEEAKKLYEAGASYVVMPPYLGRRYIRDLIQNYGSNKKEYRKEKKKHLEELEYIV